MPAFAPTQNGHVSLTSSKPVPNVGQLSGIADDSRLFALFAILAREAGRDDLQTEFTRRATGDNPNSPTHPTPKTSPEADRLQKDGCRLIHSGKLIEAEAAFRQAIKLDPTCADAHGNFGVALAQQRRLSEAEAAFHLAIRFAPTKLTMYVNLATSFIEQGRHQEGECWARQAIRRQRHTGSCR